jgi:hypothetical protein
MRFLVAGEDHLDGGLAADYRGEREVASAVGEPWQHVRRAARNVIVYHPPDGADACRGRWARGSLRARQGSHELVGEAAEEAFAAPDASRAKGEDLHECDPDEDGVCREVAHEPRDRTVYADQPLLTTLERSRSAHEGFQPEAIQRGEEALHCTPKKPVECLLGYVSLAHDLPAGELGITLGSRNPRR